MTSPARSIARRMATVALLLTGLSGCATLEKVTTPDCEGEWWTETTFYFGRGIGAETEASEKSWRAFVGKEVTPRFPDGFTILSGKGAWANPILKSTIYENTKLLIVLHPASEANSQKVNELAEAYRSQFNQQASLTSSHPACTTFHIGAQKS